jgi:hypothetical protein
MSTIRNDFGLTSRNDSFLARVKRINSVGNWSYNSLLSRSFIISSVPDSPVYSPFKNTLSTFTQLVISIYKLLSPLNGMEDVMFYEIFIKNVTAGSN